MRLAALGLLLSPKPLYACAVCFGKSAGSEGFVRGLTIGIAVLLTFTFSLLSWLTWIVYRIEKSRQ